MRVKRERQGFAYALRGAAALLLTASLLCAFGAQAMAAGMAVASPVAVNKPAVTVEGNAVVNSNGQFTGFFELALKVRTTFYYDNTGAPTTDPAKIDDSKTVSHPFSSAAVALRYDTTLLTPVSWSYTQEDYVTNKPGVDVSGASSISPVELETKKPDTGITAAVQVEDYIAADANNSGRPTALLTLSAESGNTNVFYENETVVCVVRFKYDMTRLVMNQTDSYEFLRPAGAPTGAGSATQSCVVWFAEDNQAAKSTVGQSVRYQGMQSRTAVTDKDRTYLYYYLKAPTLVGGLPDTAGQVVFSEAVVGTKDYTTNLLEVRNDKEPGALAFRLVNNKSYANGGVNVDSLATILFYDWDNTLINVLTVEKGDVRAAVNAHVEKTMIHPDLRASTHPGADYMDSLDRLYTYRGKYPAEGPSGSTTVTNGDKYVLTNKLDYALYRRPTTLEEDVPGDPDTTKHWEVTDNASATTDAYPYANGWAVVADIKNIENVWTTFGVGELKDIDPADPSGKYTTQGTAANYFELLDFSNLDAGVYYVKACYEEGTSLNKSDNYSLIGEVNYTRYSNVASATEGSSYSIKYEYGRISEAGFGVGRTRDPSVKLYYTTDKEGASDQKFFLEVAVKNIDVMQVEFTPTGTFLSMQYSLVEKYGFSNFIEGVARTTYGNVLDIFANYNYGDGWSYDNRFGSDGFVYIGTLNQIMEYGTKAVKTGDSTAFNNLLTYQTFQDLNLRRDANGAEITTAGNASSTATKVLDAIDKVLQYGGAGMLDKNGNVVLDWHQLQYHIIHYDTGGIYNGAGIMSKADCVAADGGYLWCHQDECGGGSGAIASLTDLLKAAYKVYDGSFPNALDQLNINLLNNLFLRADMKGSVYQSDLVNFKAVLNTAVGKLTTDGPYNAATIGTATWKELQYALIFGAYIKDANITENFWWQNGQAPAVGSFADLTELAFKAYVDGYHPDVIKNVSMTIVNKYYLRADKDGVKFADVTAFLNAMKTAVQALSADGGYTAATIRTVDWIEVQHLLIPGNTYRTKTDLRGDATIDYWWENGGSPSIKTIGDLMKAAYGVYINGDDPNNVKGANMAKMKEFFFRATIDGDAFTSDPPILTALEAAVKALTAPSGPYDGTDIDTATWKEIQYALIHGTYLADGSITEDYWWAGGGSPTISTIADLLKYGYKVHVAGGDKDLLKNATLTVIDGFYLRKDLTGAKFTTQAAFDTAYKKALQALTTSPGPYNAATVETATWKELQYALIHGTYLADSVITEDYWWEAGGSKVISTLPDLLTAAYFVYGDGSQPNALDGLNMDKVSNAPMWLRKDTDGNVFASESEVKTMLQQLVTKVKDLGFDATTISGLAWIQVQHMLLGNGYATDGDLVGNPNINYWWWNGGSKPTGENPELVMQNILVVASESNPNFGMQDPSALTAILAQYIDGLKFQDAGGGAYTVGTLQAAIETMVAESYDNGYESFWDPETAYVVMTWQEVQHYLITGLTEKEGTFPAYGWKPALVDSVTTFSLADLLQEETTAELPLEIPEMPELPTEPEIPVTPEIPEEPVTPKPPIVPEEPEVPAVPPVKPEEPVVPEEPTAPPVEEPAVPETPDIPPEEAHDAEEIPQSRPEAATAPLSGAPSEVTVSLASLTKGGLPEGALLPHQGNSPPAQIGAEGLTLGEYVEKISQSLSATQGELSQSDKRARPGVAPLVNGRSFATDNPAALPPPDPRTFYYRRTIRRKKTMCPANRGGINL